MVDFPISRRAAGAAPALSPVARAAARARLPDFDDELLSDISFGDRSADRIQADRRAEASARASTLACAVAGVSFLGVVLASTPLTHRASAADAFAQSAVAGVSREIDGAGAGLDRFAALSDGATPIAGAASVSMRQSTSAALAADPTASPTVRARRSAPNRAALFDRDAETFWRGGKSARAGRATPPAWSAEIAVATTRATSHATSHATTHDTTRTMSTARGSDRGLAGGFQALGPDLVAAPRRRPDFLSSPVQLASLGPTSFLESAPVVPTQPTTALGAEITIVLTAFGLNADASDDALRTLPPSIAVAIAPIAENPGDWAAAAKRDGRIALIEAPMEPSSYPRINPGPLTLLTGAEANQNVERLADILSKTPNIDGVSAYLGDKFVRDRTALSPVLSELARRDLGLFEPSPSGRSHIAALARDIDLDAARGGVSLDNGGRTKDITRGLERLEAMAKRNGYAIGVGVAVPSTVQGLAAWAEGLAARGFRLTPLRL